MATELDRRTRMVNSSVNAPLKKGGAGGQYTWGTPLDVQDFVSTNVQGAGYGVVTAPSPVASVTVKATESFQMDQSAFPTLGSAPAAPAVTSWGPVALATTPQVLNASSLRTGALDLVDGQHPRNQFAKKPNVRTIQTAVVSQSGLIDWSQVGMPDAVLQAVVKSNANSGAAHLGPYQQAAPVAATPYDVLQAQNAATVKQYMTQKPKVSMPLASQKPFIIQQPQKR